MTASRTSRVGGMRAARRIFGGFTLLEVMVAVAILGVALVAIFSSEAGAVRNGARARRLTTATLLARCKMGEVEETVMREGLPAVSALGTDDCCEDGEVEGFTCEWEIERIVLPDEIMFGPTEEEGEEGALGGLLGGGGEEDPSSGFSMSAPPSPDMLMSGAMLGSGDPFGDLALQIAFPILKPHIEEQVRRATVTVRWNEGDHERELMVVQFLVAEQPAALLTNAAADALLSGTPPGGTPPPGTPPTPSIVPPGGR
jgi:general secretion pathway protein I